jgi:hypothetical protein
MLADSLVAEKVSDCQLIAVSRLILEPLDEFLMNLDCGFQSSYESHPLDAPLADLFEYCVVEFLSVVYDEIFVGDQSFHELGVTLHFLSLLV